MKGVLFYEEYGSAANKRAGKSERTVVAIQCATARVENRGSDLVTVYDGVGGVFIRQNTPVASSAIAADYLHDACKRISEERARELHPALFEWLDRSE